MDDCRCPARHWMARWRVPGFVLLVAMCVACGGSDPPPARSDAPAAASMPAPVATSGDRTSRSAGQTEPCAVITGDDIQRISGYANTTIRPGMSEGSCLRQTADERFSVVVTRGRYVDLRSSLGGRHVDLGHGLTGYENSTGWITAVIYPDGSSINVGISGRALSNEPGHADYQVALADGRVVDMAGQDRAYIDTVVAHSR